MKKFLFFLPFIVTSLFAELPDFEISLGVGAQYDHSSLTIFTNAFSDQRSLDLKFNSIWTPVARAKIKTAFDLVSLSYQAELGYGGSGDSDFNVLFVTTAQPPFFTSHLSDTKVWNQEVTLAFEVPCSSCFSVIPLVGWNQFETKWRVGSPSVGSFDLGPFFGPDTDVTGHFSFEGSRIRERFSGAFVGFDLRYVWNCFDACVGYSYTFGSFSTGIPHIAIDFFSDDSEFLQNTSAHSVSSKAEGHLGHAALSYCLNSCWSFFVEGNVRYIEKRTGTLAVANMSAGNPTNMSNNPFSNKWTAASFSVGATFSF